MDVQKTDVKNIKTGDPEQQFNLQIFFDTANYATAGHRVLRLTLSRTATRRCYC